MREYFMKTERIGFSKWDTNDIRLARLLWRNTEVTKYLCASGRFTEHDVNERLAKEIDNESKFHVQYWPIFRLDGNCFIGCCGLRPYRLADDIYEIGFHLLPDYWGEGFGTEAAKAVIEYAHKTLNAKDLFVGHHPDNTASAIMLMKLGFCHTHNEYYEPTGLNHPSYMYRN